MCFCAHVQEQFLFCNKRHFRFIHLQLNKGPSESLYWVNEGLLYSFIVLQNITCSRSKQLAEWGITSSARKTPTSFPDSVSRSINNNPIMKAPLTKMHICDSRVRLYNGTRLKLHIKILDFNSKLVFLLGMSDPATICQRIDSPSVSALNKKLILSSPSAFLSIHHPQPLPPHETLPSRHVTTK
jgi:hypothetical protein